MSAADPPSKVRPSLRLIRASHNQFEGNSAGYGGFVSWCKPTSGSGVVADDGQPFLVIPMALPATVDLPISAWSCGASRWAVQAGNPGVVLGS